MFQLTWARFHCLFCHGYEEKNVVSAGVLAVGDISAPMMSLHMARMAKRLAPKVTIYTDGAEELALFDETIGTIPEIVDATSVNRMPGRICVKLRRPAGSQACRMKSAITMADRAMP